MPQNKPPVGWVGAGKMGLPILSHLIDAGYPVTVVDPAPDNLIAAQNKGASKADSLKELCDVADIIFVMIPDDAVLRSVAFGSDGLTTYLRSDHTLVEMSTVSPKISFEVADALAAKGVGYIRAPVSGSTATAAAAQLTVLASGPKEVMERIDPLLVTFSSRRFHVGEGEEARYLKLVLNSLVGGTSALLAEALTLGHEGGLTIENMMEVISESVVTSPLIGYKREMLESGDFKPAFTVAQMKKDFDLILEAAEGHETRLLSEIHSRYVAAIDAGKSQRDFFVLADRAAPDRTFSDSD